MEGKAFFSVSMSLDGFIAPEFTEDLVGQQRVTHLTYAVRER